MVAQIPITSSEIKLTVVNVLKLKFYSGDTIWSGIFPGGIP
jgi:hypothetical protein